MPIAAVLLFGSLARADPSEGSDTDLLMINTDDQTSHVTTGHLSMFLYPWHRLKLDAQDGDLFVCHLVREAKAIFDPAGYLPKLQEAFHFRSDYQREVTRATDFGWFLARFGGELNSALQAKRTLWCIRTILIARSAELRDPIFAPHLLAERTKSGVARELLTRRHDRWDDAILRHNLRLFLEEETKPDTFYELANRTSFVERFKQTTNEVALQTLRQEDRSRAGYM